jgi:hypothetical protein
VAFIKANNNSIYLVQYYFEEPAKKTVKHRVPPAIATNGEVGEITAIRFW